MGADYKPHGASHFHHQDPAVLNQATPNIDQWYPILPPTANVGICEIGINIEDTNETLEVRVDLDGVEKIGAIAAAHSASNWVYKQVNAITRTTGLIIDPNGNFYVNRYGMLFEGLLVSVDVRKTTAAGVGNLTGIVTYAVKTKI